jgi:hypothetical protein
MRAGNKARYSLVNANRQQLIKFFKEPLINSESFSCAGKMHQIKTPIAGNSTVITKIGNAELVHFNKQMLIHELIRGSLGILSISISFAFFSPTTIIAAGLIWLLF